MEFQHITSGYRRPCDNVSIALASMFTLHNETINAWSMVFGVITISILTSIHPDPSMFHYLHIIALWIHLPLSFVYHTMTCSPKYSMTLRKLDVIGVLIASDIIAFTLSGLVFGFMHFMTWFLSICGFCLIVYQYYNFYVKTTQKSIDNESRLQTAKILGLAVVIYNVPIIYLLVAPKIASYVKLLCCIEVIAVSSAAILYVTGYPESQYPGRFDLVGNSHNLAHILLVIQQLCIWFIINKIT
jgi:adiponectin receptor